MKTRVKTLSHTLCFTAPVFMGNAEQNAQWRTPPIKALLRQWWRVAYAAEKNFALRVDEMRHEEGLLFGHAWLDDDRNARGEKVSARKSAVRIRLGLPAGQQGDAWGKGTQTGVSPLTTGLDTSYAWFGLINRGDGLPDRNALAIKGQENRRELLLAVPEPHAPRIQTALQLIHHFGQLGARSRGGWGSFALDGISPLSAQQLAQHAQTLTQCLRHDWPMSLCKDDQGLCLWQSKNTFPSWDKAMRSIALERKNVRVALKSLHGRDLRPVLGFASPGRMPNPLRWRVVPAASGQLGIQVFAMPTLIPEEGKQRIDATQVRTAWDKVIQTLDASSVFKPRGAQK